MAPNRPLAVVFFALMCLSLISVAASVAAMVALGFGSIERVANLTNAALFLTFVVINLSVVALRFIHGATINR